MATGSSIWSTTYGGAKVAFDIHRFEDGWSVGIGTTLQQLPSAANPSGRTMIDGECTLGLQQTLENKALVSKFVNEVMIDH